MILRAGDTDIGAAIVLEFKLGITCLVLAFKEFGVSLPVSAPSCISIIGGALTLGLAVGLNTFLHGRIGEGNRPILDKVFKDIGRLAIVVAFNGTLDGVRTGIKITGHLRIVVDEGIHRLLAIGSSRIVRFT